MMTSANLCAYPAYSAKYGIVGFPKLCSISDVLAHHPITWVSSTWPYNCLCIFSNKNEKKAKHFSHTSTPTNILIYTTGCASLSRTMSYPQFSFYSFFHFSFYLCFFIFVKKSGAYFGSILKS